MREQRWSREAAAARAWWASLTPQPAQNGGIASGDRAALARLRRAASIIEAVAEPATADLYRRVGLAKSEQGAQRTALVAAVLAHVRKDDPTPIANAIGSRRGDNDTAALLTPLRFKRLVAAREADELLIAFRRVVSILGDQASVRDLARLLLGFTDPDERQANISRTRFAFDYHGAGQYAPDAEDTTETSQA